MSVVISTDRKLCPCQIWDSLEAAEAELDLDLREDLETGDCYGAIPNARRYIMYFDRFTQLGGCISDDELGNMRDLVYAEMGMCRRNYSAFDHSFEQNVVTGKGENFDGTK